MARAFYPPPKNHSDNETAGQIIIVANGGCRIDIYPGTSQYTQQGISVRDLAKFNAAPVVHQWRKNLPHPSKVPPGFRNFNNSSHEPGHSHHGPCHKRPPRALLPTPSRPSYPQRHAPTDGALQSQNCKDDRAIAMHLERKFWKQEHADAKMSAALAAQEAMHAESERLTREHRQIMLKYRQVIFRCSICIEDLPLDSVANVEQCGHQFCRECLRTHIVSNLRSGVFPVICPLCKANPETGKVTGRPPILSVNVR